ncbi:MAG: glycosyltransferase family 2 protein [Thermoplasmatales archaeon]
MNPSLSVIITAYNRRKFLKESVTSVLASDFDKGKFEVIVVKNFIDEELDGFLLKNNIMNILSQNVNIGEQISIGLGAANGQIIAFLDDDDRVLPERLKTVYENFLDDDLVYYHNSSCSITEDSERLHGNVVPQIKKQFILYPDTCTTLKSILNSNSDVELYSLMFNLSCVAIRKEIIEHHLSYLRRIEDGTDHFFLYLALMSNRKMKFDNIVLTEYRTHQSASNPFNNLKKIVEMGNDSIHLFSNTNHYSNVLEDMTKDTPVHNLICCKILEEKIILRILSFNVKNQFTFTDLIDYQKCLRITSHVGIKKSMIRLIFMFSSVLNPYFTGIFYILYRQKRRRLRLLRGKS